MRPRVDKDRPEHRPGGVREPLDRLIEDAPVHQGQRQHARALEDQGPQEPHHHRAEHDRVEEHRAPERPAPDITVQHQRGDQREQDHDRHLEDHEDDRVCHRLLKLVVFAVLPAGIDLHVRGQALEVVGAGELPLREVDALPVRDGEADVDEQRREGIEPEDQQVRDQKHIGKHARAGGLLQHFDGPADRTHHARAKAAGGSGDEEANDHVGDQRVGPERSREGIGQRFNHSAFTSLG